MSKRIILLKINLDDEAGNPEEWDWHTLLDLLPQETVEVSEYASLADLANSVKDYVDDNW